MAKNDKILIDGIIDERIDLKLPSEKRDEAFEYFSFEQILKDYDLSSEEIELGSVDGRNDGGIDGFFIFVNGHSLFDPETFNWPKSGSVLEVWIITCKYHDTFKQAPLDNLAASILELFDFTLESSQLKLDYSELILRYRENLKLAYRKVSPRLSRFSINFCYASRGVTTELGESIVSRSKQIKQITEDFFGNCFSDFLFYGSTELIELHRKVPNFSLELPFIEDLSSGETYILLVNLKDYYSFVQDEGKLRRYLFDSNVRDFMGLNRVNEDIRSTLTNTESPDFWWLNNGITILATGASVIGNLIQIRDIQIVNGLQTSESIFRHFESGGTDPNRRSVLVKVIVSNDSKIRDTIIRATNNQTSVELASLHATDKIQRDIEDILKQHDYYYERRANYYINQGFSLDKVITPLYVASGYVSLILKAPIQASRLKSRFMRSEVSYERVFSAQTDLNVWPKIAHILKCTDSFLESVRRNEDIGSERFLKSSRQLLSFLTVSRLTTTYYFSTEDLVNLSLNDYNANLLQESWALMKNLPQDSSSRFKMQESTFIKLCQIGVEAWNIKGIESIVKKTIKGFDRHKGGKNSAYLGERKHEERKPITKEFALMVNELLPHQPWKPGMGTEIIAKLGCTKSDFSGAIDYLIEEGLRYTQKEGIVYDQNGDVIMFDAERVDTTTLKLK